MRKLKWILGGLFAFLVALLVAGYAVIANYPVEDLKALIERQALEATGRKLQIAGDAEIEVSFSPSIVLQDVRFQNAPWAVGDDMVTMQRLEIEVEVWPLLSGEVRVKRLVMIEPIILLHRNAEGLGNWEVGSSSGASGQGLTNLPSFESVLFSKARVVFKDEQAGIQRTLELDRLEARGRDLVSPIAVSTEGRLDGVAFDVEVELASVERMAAGGPFPLTLKGQLAGAELSLTGQVGPPQDGGNDVTLSLAGPSLAPLGALAGAALPATGPFSLAGHLVQEGSRYAIDQLAATVGASDLTGQVALDLGGERPLLSGALISKRLVLADFAAGDATAEPAGGSGLFSDVPVPLDLLRTLDAELQVRAAELVLGPTTLTAVDTTLALRQGRLEAAPLAAGYGAGQVSGALVLDAAPDLPALAIDLQGSGLDLAEASSGAMTGSLAIDLDLKARGASPKAWAASLTGHSELSSGDGRIDSKLLAVASAPLFGVLGPLFGGDSEVRLNCLVNRMAWQDGIGTNQGTAIDASTFSVIGNGTINLRNETIDFYVDTWSKDTALVGLAVPLTVRGPLTSPSVAPDPAGTALGIAKTAGLIIFPPAGLAAIISEREQAQAGNACVAVANEVASKGGPESFFEDIGGAAGEVIDGAGEAVEGAGKAIGEGAEEAIKGLKSIFD